MTNTESGEAVDQAPRRAAAPAVFAFLTDAALVVIFAAIGRASHSENVLAGLWNTSWTFLLALAVGWGAARAWRSPSAPIRVGVPVWGATVAGGMLLRWATGQGVQTAFVVVAAVVLLLMLVGWRVLARLIGRSRRAGVRNS